MGIFFTTPVWKKAFWFLCGWFALTFSIYIAAKYFTSSPFASTIYNGVAIYFILCLLIIPIWRWCRLISKLNIPLQVIIHVFSVIIWYYVMGSIYYFFDYYLDNFRTIAEWKEYLTILLGTDAFQLYYQYFTAVFTFYIIDYTQKLKEKEKHERELALQNQEMQLSLLKSQINPHFLFNTLNSISMLIGSNKEKAREMINRLSQVFRYALESYDDQQVSLSDELRFTENYLNIQKVRFDERLNYFQNVEDDCMNIMVPPMVLQPIVENSVKHGIGPKDEGGSINITIKKDNGYVQFEVSDDGLGINAGNSKGIGEKGTGVGLAVSDQRLKKMYGEQSGLRLDADKNGFTVSFKIPAN